MSQVFAFLVAIVLVLIVLRQCRRPFGFVGRFFLWQMNFTHSSLTDWGLTHVPIEPRSTILDVGCGGGRTVQKLAKAAAEGRVSGLDYSRQSVAASRRTNAQSIAEGRVEIREGSVAHLPSPPSLDQRTPFPLAPLIVRARAEMERGRPHKPASQELVA